MSEQQQLDLEQAPEALEGTARSLPRGARAFLWLTGIVLVAVSAFVLFRSYGGGQDETAAVTDDTQTTRSGIANPLPVPKVERTRRLVPAPAPKPDVAPPIPVIINSPPPQAQKVDEVEERRLKSPLSAESGGQDASSSQNSGQDRQRVDAGPMADKLRPLELVPSVAGQLGNRNFLITQGTMIDCGQVTKLVTTQAGMLTCVATHDVMSANGLVKLIDAGTKFTGYQTGGIVQGQARAFVTWNRLETPTGVILVMGSPGTGPLGEAGVDGFIDSHFWERFGNAILLSLVGDMGNWAANQGQSGDNNIRFDTTREGGQDVIAKILEKSVDIPPTLYKNQGGRIGIMVARDLDFSHVYDLQPVQR